MEVERAALARIVAGLFALLGLGGSKLSDAAPRRIGRSLRRTILFVLRPAESAARRLIYLLSLTIRTRPAPARPMPSGIARAGKAKERAAFPMFDPRLRLVRKAKVVRGQPRITLFGGGETRTMSFAAAQTERAQAGSEIDSMALLRRLGALEAALGDLPRQARRLLRARQRRNRSPRLRMQGPMRPGYPPGHRSRKRHEIDEILRRCHSLAREALPPDTS